MKKDYDFISSFDYIIFEIRYGTENLSIPDYQVSYNGMPDNKFLEHLESYYDDDVIDDMFENSKMYVFDFVNDGEDLICLNVEDFPEDKYDDIFYFDKLYIKVIM